MKSITEEFAGNVFYYLHEECTVLHRVDGPAIEYADGSKSWYLNGKRHRTDGPAIEMSSGTREWYLNGKRHRTDGPAIEYPNGDVEWWVDGRCHNLTGPAVQWPKMSLNWYYLNGERVEREKFVELASKSA